MENRSYVLKKSKQPKCPNCGAYLKFDPKSGKLSCEHCDTYVEINKDVNVRERAFTELNAFERWQKSEVACYRCANCGASTVLPKTTIATECPFCASPVVVDVNNLSTVRPDTVIPFELGSKDALEALSKWRKKKYFAPGKFRKEVSPDSIKGVFTPVWTFDSYTTTEYDGKLGKRRTRTVYRDGKSYTESYTEYFHVSGTVDKVFDDLFVRGNDHVPEKYFNALQPFPQSRYVVYSDEFLAGYIADNYTLDPFAAFDKARAKMKSVIEREIVSSYNADTVSYLNLDMHINEKSFKYLMLPMYVAATRFNKKLYNQYVSGIVLNKERNRVRVSGSAPVSAGKVVATVLGTLAVITGIALLIYFTGAFEGGDFYFFFKNLALPGLFA